MGRVDGQRVGGVLGVCRPRPLRRGTACHGRVAAWRLVGGLLRQRAALKVQLVVVEVTGAVLALGDGHVRARHEVDAPDVKHVAERARLGAPGDGAHGRRRRGATVQRLHHLQRQHKAGRA